MSKKYNPIISKIALPLFFTIFAICIGGYIFFDYYDTKKQMKKNQKELTLDVKVINVFTDKYSKHHVIFLVENKMEYNFSTYYGHCAYKFKKDDALSLNFTEYQINNEFTYKLNDTCNEDTIKQ